MAFVLVASVSGMFTVSKSGVEVVAVEVADANTSTFSVVVDMGVSGDVPMVAAEGGSRSNSVDEEAYLTGIRAHGRARAAYSSGGILNSYSFPCSSWQMVQDCIPILVAPGAVCPDCVSKRSAVYAAVQVSAGAVEEAALGDEVATHASNSKLSSVVVAVTD